MNSAFRFSAFVLVLLCCASCEDSRPTSPTATVATLPPVTPLPSPAIPPLSGPSRTFNFDRPLSYGVSPYTKSSRFILYENGGFVLEYPTLGGSYRGRYTEANGAISFQWEGWNWAGEWAASGRATEDLLTVEYNVIMELTDFENAVYTLAR